MDPTENLKHVADTLRNLAALLRVTQYTQPQISLLAAKLGGLAVLVDGAIEAIDRPTAEEWGPDDRVSVRDELVTQELPEEERHHAR